MNTTYYVKFIAYYEYHDLIAAQNIHEINNIIRHDSADTRKR